MDKHWHVAYGIPGYGPEGTDGYTTATDYDQLCNAVRDELRDSADMLTDQANGIAETAQRYEREMDAGHRTRHAVEEWREAWFTLKRAEELDTLRANFDPARQAAPLYVDNLAAWHETVDRLIGENFPLVITEGPASSLYVWQCDNAECEHLSETE